MTRPRILVVDDEPAARVVVEAALAGLDVDVVLCASAAEAEVACAEPLDAAILDLMMPEVDGRELCRRMRRWPLTRDVPILMLTAHTGREEKLACLEAGADDFLAKPVDRLELRTRIAAICRFNRHRRAREERDRLDALVTSSPSSVVVLNADGGRVRFANEQAVRLLGGGLAHPALAGCFDARAELTLMRMLGQARDGEAISAAEAPWRLTHGAQECTVSAAGVMWEGDAALQLVLTDITPLRRFEREVHRLERLDVTSRLAASVVHDLATVLQLCAVHLRTLSGPAESAQAQTALEEMRRALRRGAQLTRDLLGFSRRGREAPGGSCDATLVIGDVARLFESLLPASVALTVRVPDQPCPVGIADYQLEQTLVNLASNARDAMPRGGALEVTLTPGESPGEWVELTVRDTGTGFDPVVRERLGEPFLSTKPEGQGAGLGLWSVRRVLDGAGGDWAIESTETGTLMRIKLPPAPHVSAMR